jgi:hypothetical protein
MLWESLEKTSPNHQALEGTKGELYIQKYMKTTVGGEGGKTKVF